ncbi:hypothetical protein SAMN05192554_1445 [Haloarchaeobius iranensis]|uniref:Uncharacterized protein n=2 Tax=Haloarchaeobius iranensis TaxID=996166 RepID=A0A1H0BM75_9EURY|nr:hypothetical protein SAMN05192554_1445 [Haloarchaeobius iranensis]
MLNSKEFEASQRRNAEQRRAMIKQWAEYVRTHDDAEWSRQQNKLINSQLQSANEMAADGETDPVRFAEARDDLADR